MNLGLPSLGRGADCPCVDRHSPPRVRNPGLRKQRLFDCEEMRVGKAAVKPPPEWRQRRVDEGSAANIRHVRLQEPRQAGVETPHGESPAIAGKGASQCRDPSPEVTINLYFQEERDPSRDE